MPLFIDLYPYKIFLQLLEFDDFEKNPEERSDDSFENFDEEFLTQEYKFRALFLLMKEANFLWNMVTFSLSHNK